MVNSWREKLTIQSVVARTARKPDSFRAYDTGREYPGFQGNENVLHAQWDQYSPEQGIFETDIAVKVEPVGGIAPEADAEHLVEKISGDQLQPSGDQGGEQKIDAEGSFFSGASPWQKAVLIGVWRPDQEIQQQKGKPIDGAERQRHKAAVIKTAIACQKKEGLHRPAQEGDHHEQYEILACTLERTSHPAVPTF